MSVMNWKNMIMTSTGFFDPSSTYYKGLFALLKVTVGGGCFAPADPISVVCVCVCVCVHS